MDWFGEPWGAPVNEDCGRTATPDWPCLGCGARFEKTDRGVITPFMSDPEGRGKAAYHLGCFLEMLGLDGQPGQA